MRADTLTRLYVEMQPEDEIYESNLARHVIESYWENRRLHEPVDEIKEKNIKFVHQEHWDEDTIQQRRSVGLPSVVADKTLSIYKTLDGYARGNKFDIKFVQVGSDDFEGAELHNKIHGWIKSSKDLHHYQSEAYGMSAICDEGYFYIYPELNGLGEVDPAFSVQDAFECYPDPNFKDPIEMNDADFIDLPFWINPRQIERKFRDHMDRIFKDKLENYSPSQATDSDRARNTYKNRDGQVLLSSNGMVLGFKRFYKKSFTKEFITDAQGNVVQEYTSQDRREGVTKSVITEMGYDTLKIDTQELWELVMIPDVSQEDFVYNMPSDFQPINPNKLGKVRWPIVRIPFTQVAGKAVGAIRGVTSLQEMRNLILSGLMHHLQTAANGGMLYEKTAFGGDEVQKNKFDTKRNQAGVNIEVADGALKEQRIQPIPRGETAFHDGGAFLENIIQDVMRDISGAEPVMKGQAQKGSPASLFQLQIQQSQNQLLSSTEYFKFFQNTIAEILYSFVRQFWTSERILMIEGMAGNTPEQISINQQNAEGVLNDPAQGLYTVFKTSAPVTESQRRQKLADSLEVAKAFAEIGVPTFVQDLTEAINNLDTASPEQKQILMKNIKQWQANQGILDEATIMAQQAQAQAAMNQTQGGQPVPTAPPAQ